jgi:hypothetical protein
LIFEYFSKSVEKIEVLSKTDISGTLKEDQYNLTFFIISHSVLLRMRNVSEKVAEKIKTHVLCPVTFFFENLAIYEIMWKHFVMPDRPQMTMWRMRVACWIPRTTSTYSEYVILLLFHCNNGCTKAPQC